MIRLRTNSGTTIWSKTFIYEPGIQCYLLNEDKADDVINLFKNIDMNNTVFDDRVNEYIMKYSLLGMNYYYYILKIALSFYILEQPNFIPRRMEYA